MLRAVLVGLLCVSTIACKGKKDEASTVQGPAGTVLDVTGTVTVAGKPLSKGATVAADDVVETGTDGHVIIELAHNQARWELGPDKHEKVSASLAWSLAKNTGTAKPVDQDTSAAGRPAERSAADTSVTATKNGTADQDQKKAEVAPAQAPAAMAPAATTAPTTGSSPPPPPAAQPVAPAAAGDAVRSDEGLIGKPSGGGKMEKGAPLPAKTAAPAKPSKKVTVPGDDYLKCLTGITALHLVLHGHAGGKTTYDTGGIKLPADAKACVDRVTAKIKLDDGAHAEIDVSK